MSEKKQPAVIYCRVSDTKQKTEGHGLESQEVRCLEYAKSKGYEVVATYKDDASGGDLKRPQSEEMLKYLRANRRVPHVIIIEDISRLARDTRIWMWFRDELAKTNSTLECPSFQFGETSEAWLMEMMSVNFAEYHRLKNAEQTRNRMWGRMMNGYWVFKPPIGFKYEKVGPHGKLLVRDEPVASILQEALERYADGRLQTLSEVKRYLESEPDFPKDTKQGEVRIQRIREWLTQVLYAGYIERPDWDIELREAQHDGIISLHTYRKIQDRLAGRKTNTATAAVRQDLREEMPLRGFVLCGDCDRPLTGGRSKGRKKYYVYYECHNKECVSHRKSIRKADIEKDFEMLLATATPTRKLFEFVHTMLKDLWEKHGERLVEQRKSLTHKIREVDAKIETLVDRTLETSSQTLIERYEARLRDLELEKAALVEQSTLPVGPQDTFKRTFRTAMDFLGNPLKLWNSSRFEDKRAVLKLTFADQLAYKRNEGFRTANFSLPFKLLGDFSALESKMVPAAGLEPAQPKGRGF
ncbi:hypothetical protein JCM17844_17980 [Iodidimonas gelatinilytica]|uniref:Recombinase family protein n=1 Tax=Iodidimonas gelatinilytica TaxID=1236966 RepID=A0A5A7MQF0_9PROT|nr:hypothetical protein JCM17844_17980 [Iodidimonas gelatinilytica]